MSGRGCAARSCCSVTKEHPKTRSPTTSPSRTARRHSPRCTTACAPAAAPLRVPRRVDGWAAHDHGRSDDVRADRRACPRRRSTARLPPLPLCLRPCRLRRTRHRVAAGGRACVAAWSAGRRVAGQSRRAGLRRRAAVPWSPDPLSTKRAPRSPCSPPQGSSERWTTAATIAAEQAPTMRTWEFHDLLFHTRSRRGRNDLEYGGTYRFRGQLPPLPALKPLTSNRIIFVASTRAGRGGRRFVHSRARGSALDAGVRGGPTHGRSAWRAAVPGDQSAGCAAGGRTTGRTRSLDVPTPAVAPLTSWSCIRWCTDAMA